MNGIGQLMGGGGRWDQPRVGPDLRTVETTRFADSAENSAVERLA